MKWINARFPDLLHEEIAEAANAEERPIGSWLRIAAKEKLARDREPTSARTIKNARGEEFPAPVVPVDELLNAPKAVASPDREVTPRFKKGGKK
jgi:hypothetical protein